MKFWERCALEVVPIVLSFWAVRFLFKFNVSENDEQRLNAQIPWLFPIMKSSLWGTNYLASTRLGYPDSAPKFWSWIPSLIKIGDEKSMGYPEDKNPESRAWISRDFAKLSWIKSRKQKNAESPGIKTYRSKKSRIPELNKKP